MDLDEEQIGDVPTRPMRCKILYTFDQENSTTCLARMPNILDVPAVAIDDNTQVGVIELGQCLQAITTASPEIVSRLASGDFTIYAYDYSEYDTPLVGQGMLSAALFAGTPNLQNKTMITGRICKNKLAIFSNGVTETLEVKIRLVPVPKPAGSMPSLGIDDFRATTPAMSSGFDPNAWNTASQQNRSLLQTSDYFGFDELVPGSDKDSALIGEMFGLDSESDGMESGQQLAGGVGIAETPTDPSFGFNPALLHSAPGSRAGSPMIGLGSSNRNELLRHQSFSGNISTFTADQARPSSRASVRSEHSTFAHQRQASAPSIPQQVDQHQPELYYNEDDQPRKRVKVMPVDWHGRSSFGSRNPDLRVTASTAASMHMHRPIPKRPSAPGSNLEPPPRVPTPVPSLRPSLAQQQQLQSTASRRSFLRQASTADSDFLSDIDNFSDAIVSSPEDDSPGNSITAEGTPQDIPSSPPIYAGSNVPLPSSPGLPTAPPNRLADSGYMSERGLNSGNIIDSVEDEDLRGFAIPDYNVSAEYQQHGKQTDILIKREDSAAVSMSAPSYGHAWSSTMNIALETPGDMDQLPQKMLLNLPPVRREGSQGPKPSKPPAAPKSKKRDKSATSPAPASRMPSEQPHSRRGSLALPPRPIAPSSDLPDQHPTQKPTLKKRQSLHRSHTSSNDSEAGSPAPSDTEADPKGPGRSGSGAQRRKIIEQRLLTSIEKGEMPQFCSHCGAIETPTWRKLYVKHCEGKPSPLDSAEGEGETIGVEVTETDDTTSEATKFVIRKTIRKGVAPGAGFEHVSVCNPCGLWFNKFRVMRPSGKWGRKSGQRRPKRQSTAENGMSTDGVEPPSEFIDFDQTADEELPSGEDGSGGEQPPVAKSKSRPVPNGRPRANSMQAQQSRLGAGQGTWKASQLDAALARAVQSSPVRFNGSQQSPIEIEDLTPKPTRRLLFPSPRREGEVKSLDDNAQVSLRAMPPISDNLSGKIKSPLRAELGLSFEQTNTNIFEAFTFDKENFAPPLDGQDDDLSYLFGGSPSGLFKTPRKTPSKATPHLNRNLLTTPSASTRKRKPLTPSVNAANNANTQPNDFMTSPSSARYWLRATPSRLERTPGRLSQVDGAGDNQSPWSRHFAQLMSDAIDPHTLTSPSRGFDFSDLPTFTTPGRLVGDYGWESLGDILSSEFAGYEGGQGDEQNPHDR